MTEPSTSNDSDSSQGAPLNVDVQFAVEENDGEEPPSSHLIKQWAQVAFASTDGSAGANTEVSIRLVDSSEIQSLNHQFRNKDAPTNVLSFPFENEFSDITELDLGLLGDIVLCHGVIVSEAQEQGKQLHHHYAHMVTHGILHLSGYDHDDNDDANRMEALETKILTHSGLPDPYSGA